MGMYWVREGKSLRLFYLCQIKTKQNRFFSLTLKPLLNLFPVTIPSYLPLLLSGTPRTPQTNHSICSSAFLLCLLFKYSFCLKYLLPHFRYPILPWISASLSNATFFEKPLWPQKEPLSYSPTALCLNLSQDTSLHMGSYKSSNRQIALKLRGGNNFK